MARIYKRGKLWYVDFEYKGKRYRKSLNTRSKQVAELVLKDIDVKIAKERFDLAPPEDIRFDDFTIKFLNWYKIQNAKNSYVDYHNLFKSTLIPSFSKMMISDITVEIVEEYKLKRVKEVSASTVNKELIALRHLFNKAILWGYLKNNPATAVKKLPVKQRQIRFLSTEEIYTLLKACPAYTKPIFMTAIHTGLRKSELFRLEWEDVDLNRKCIIVKNKEDSHTKNYLNREIPMTSELFETLNKLKKNSDGKSGFVFMKNDGEPHRGNMRKTILKIVEQTGIKPFTLHDLRHTFASHLVMDGIDLPSVQKLMGHSNITTTMIYAHLAPDHLRNAIARLDKRFSKNNNSLTKKV